ncbi:hypothetical protein C5167_036068 [Papaver somniferum]|nr:hypothetical protein C5167_036068 [Papaver somniferum]
MEAISVGPNSPNNGIKFSGVFTNEARGCCCNAYHRFQRLTALEPAGRGPCVEPKCIMNGRLHLKWGRREMLLIQHQTITLGVYKFFIADYLNTLITQNCSWPCKV